MIEDGLIEGDVTYEELEKGDKIVMDDNVAHWFPELGGGDSLDISIITDQGTVEKTFEIAGITELPSGILSSRFLLPDSVLAEYTSANLNDTCVITVAVSYTHLGEISVNYSEMKAYKNKEPVSLSKKELQLLLFLLENAGQIVSKEQILEKVWDLDGQFVDENTVPVNISRLKSKIGNDYIRNVRGLGYIWTEESLKE